jgi:hypothetical protein
MRTRRLATTMMMATLGLGGCSSDDKTPPGMTTQPAPFELDGAWIYLGPSDVPHDLAIKDASMAFTAVAGDWSSAWTIKAYDNELHQFQIVFGSGSGMYLPVGQSMSGSYDLSGPLLTVQLAQGLNAYPPLQDAGTCTGGTDGAAVPDCKLYIKHD